MRIGLIDVDSHNFPNIALMKISAYHKNIGDSVEMCFPLKKYDRVYASKVFDETYSRDIDFYPMTDDFRKGGSGYGLNNNLPNEIEHTMPDYALYGITSTAYGFLTRGCPRGCPFCIVAKKEGNQSVKVADLKEFWCGQKFIKLMDPNITACKDCIKLFEQLIESNAVVDFTQGIDARLCTDYKLELLKNMKTSCIHFAWDNANDDMKSKFEHIAYVLNKKLAKRSLSVYVLTNFNSSIDEDLYRIYTLRDIGFSPYVMVYNKKNAPTQIKRMQRWCNNKFIFRSTNKFEEYK